MFAILICCIFLFWMLYLWFWFFFIFVLVFAFFLFGFYIFNLVSKIILLIRCFGVQLLFFFCSHFCHGLYVCGLGFLFLLFCCGCSWVVFVFRVVVFRVFVCCVVVRCRCLFVFLLCLLFVVGPQRNKLRKRSDIEASNFMTNSRQFHDRLVSCERASVLHARWRDRAIDKTEIGRPRALKFTYMGAMGPC